MITNSLRFMRVLRFVYIHRHMKGTGCPSLKPFPRTRLCSLQRVEQSPKSWRDFRPASTRTMRRYGISCWQNGLSIPARGFPTKSRYETGFGRRGGVLPHSDSLKLCGGTSLGHTGCKNGLTSSMSISATHVGILGGGLQGCCAALALAERGARVTIFDKPDILPDLSVKGGTIVARGETDIYDPDSLLHRRYEIGLTSTGRYHSVDPGKLTMAPYFSEILAERISGAV